MKKLFKNKNYFLLFQGSLVSAIGTTLYSFAAGLYVQDLFGEEGGAVYLSLFLAVSIIIQIVLSPITGTIADKFNKVRILYVTDFIRGILFFVTFYILYLGFEKEILIWILLGVTAISSMNQAFFQPAATAVIPDVVGDDLIQQANGANSIVGSVQSILGIIAGMFLYALLGFKMAVLANAISFIFSAISEMFIKTKYKHESKGESSHFFEDIKVGFRYIVSKEGLLTMMMFSLMLNFCFTPLFGVGVPYLFRTELGASEYEIGMIDIAFGIVTFFASIVIGSMKIKSLRKATMRGISTLAISFIVLTGVIVLVTYNIIGYWVFYGLFISAMMFLAFAVIYTNVPMNTGLMKSIEPEIRGRVFATLGALATAAIPVSTIIAGFVINNSNVALLSIMLSLIIGVVTLVLTSNKKVANMLNEIDEKTNAQEASKENQAVFIEPDLESV
jgi:MFS family permease